MNRIPRQLCTYLYFTIVTALARTHSAGGRAATACSPIHIHADDVRTCVRERRNTKSLYSYPLYSLGI